MSALLFQEEQRAVKEYGIKPRTCKCTMVFMKKTSCPERKGGTCSQAREASLAFWTRKESSCLNHLPQRTVIKAFTDPESNRLRQSYFQQSFCCGWSIGWKASQCTHFTCASGQLQNQGHQMCPTLHWHCTVDTPLRWLPRIPTWNIRENISSTLLSSTRQN